jgi:tetratricopeptide (TPR) repeat protein
MAIAVSSGSSGALRVSRAATLLALIGLGIGGCSFNLGSLDPSSDRTESLRLASAGNLASLSEAIKNNPNDPQAYNRRGAALAQAGKTEEALADFNKAIGLDANCSEAYANRGSIYRQTKRLDLAMDDYERAIVLDANDAPAYLGRGLLYKARNHRRRRSPISAGRLRSPPTMPRPITIAACSTRPSNSINWRSMISPSPLVSCRSRPSPCSRAPRAISPPTR